MVSTRQSSSVASSSTDAYGASSSGTQGGAESHSGGSKALRSAGPLAPVSTNSCPDLVVVPVQLHLLDMPVEILEKILGFLDYKSIAHVRPVCRQMDRVAQNCLNSGFQKLQNTMLHRFQSIKAKMPRRESARRNHPLACESDIIETLHMRLTLLQMTFGKHIERKHCCFFAGEILDEVKRIIHYVKVTNKLARPYKVTDELFDLTTMAMEFFKEHIEPTLPEIAYFGADFIEFNFNQNSPSNKYFSMDSPPHGGKGYESPASGNEALAIEAAPQRQSNMVLRKRIRKIKQGMKRYNSQLSLLRRDLRTNKTKMADQQKQLLEYSSRLDEYDKKNEETARKFSTLLQELNKCKTELQYWRSRTAAIPPMCNNCGHVSLAPTPTPTEEMNPMSTDNMPTGLSMCLNDHSNLPIKLESLDFPAETSAASDDASLWKMYEPKESKPRECKPPPLSKPTPATATASSSASTSGKQSKKRKNTEDEQPEAKKSKRSFCKSRASSKRVKT